MNYLDEAISLACCAHKGQVDKAGSPYILHPLRLMLKFDDENLKIISVLHDVIEDSSVTIDDLRCLGFSDLIVQAIDCLSKRPDEVYEDFISRVSINELAR